MSITLFDKSGNWIEPSASALEAVTEPERAAIARIRDAAQVLDAANVAAQDHADRLAKVRSEIAALEKITPKISFNDLAKAMARDTQRRRMGL